MNIVNFLAVAVLLTLIASTGCGIVDRVQRYIDEDRPADAIAIVVMNVDNSGYIYGKVNSPAIKAEHFNGPVFNAVDGFAGCANVKAYRFARTCDLVNDSRPKIADRQFAEMVQTQIVSAPVEVYKTDWEARKDRKRKGDVIEGTYYSSALNKGCEACDSTTKAVFLVFISDGAVDDEPLANEAAARLAQKPNFRGAIVLPMSSGTYRTTLSRALKPLGAKVKICGENDWNTPLDEFVKKVKEAK